MMFRRYRNDDTRDSHEEDYDMGSSSAGGFNKTDVAIIGGTYAVPLLISIALPDMVHALGPVRTGLACCSTAMSTFLATTYVAYKHRT